MFIAILTLNRLKVLLYKTFRQFLSLIRNKSTIKAFCNLTQSVPIPLSKQEALRLWNERFSIVADEQYFWRGIRSDIVYN